jgi:hypothetical protein
MVSPENITSPPPVVAVASTIAAVVAVGSTPAAGDVAVAAGATGVAVGSPPQAASIMLPTVRSEVIANRNLADFIVRNSPPSKSVDV